MQQDHLVAAPNLPPPAHEQVDERTRRRATHALITVTRYASLETASLDAAIKDGLKELQSGAHPATGDTAELLVYFRNRRESTITIDIGIPVDHPGPSSGSLKRYPSASCLSLYPDGAGLDATMDKAVRLLGLSSRDDLPRCWQRIPLPMTKYDPDTRLEVGYLKARTHGSEKDC